MLPPKNGKGRKREIDILLTAVAAGYTIRIAIECKNEEKNIQAPAIDGFAGKLEYVDVKHGIFVAARGFTRGAKERAADAGIKLFTITGLTPDRLAAAVFEAFQSVVFLFLRVKDVALTNSSPEVTPLQAAFTDEKGNVRGTIFDAIWFMWISGRLPATIGEHKTEIDVPEGWGQINNGHYERIESFPAELQVVGLVVTHRGQYTEHALVHASDNTVEKWQVEARFDIPGLPITLHQVTSEAELEEHLQKFTGLRVVTGRFLLPRIDVCTRFGYMFWPPSDKSAAKMEMAGRAFEATGTLDPKMFGGQPIDERTIDTIFDPIWSAYQFIETVPEAEESQN